MNDAGFLDKLADMTEECQDITKQQFAGSIDTISLFFQSELVDVSRIREYFMPELVRCLDGDGNGLEDLLKENAAECLQGSDRTIEACALQVFGGKLLLYVEGTGRVYSINFAMKPQRSPEDSALEPSIRGARDGFVEELETNIALIRKRLATADLRVAYYESRGSTKTRLALLYYKDRVPASALALVRKRLENLGKTTLVGGMSRLEEALSGNRYSLVPISNFTGKPDYAAERLVRGKFLVLMEGSPTAMIAPITLTELFISPEDSYFSYHAAITNRFFRIIGAFTTIFLPGLYVALLMYNQDQIPFQLLATVGMSRIGLPISAFFEMLLSLLLLDLLREAGARLPRATGSTITMVGGIIIGDAALRAGLLSPSVTFLAAISIVSGSTLVNLNLQSTTRIFRLFVLFLSATVGIYGTIMAMLYMLVYAINVNSFGQMYFPYVKFSRKDSLLKFFRLPFRKKGIDLAKSVPFTKSEDGT
ncbi:spore germination protein [Paenibacillus ginsengarvi]|uniref:Spore germination protein n=1 Tax=Paenibacillus ginsengarvi TaxID=400777 RepID=A0A3B0CKI4_9BACL|nr:spore germination protein [Paenibacillus ginsengarvi]RKN85218.1 spore germination protein [Paenibacillus ginsengarvi]